ncbi:MAG: DNA-directed RNA polymerase subunit beta [Parcubacteria group bacterium GW2011_GWC2_38_7]|nr:MAG: DNA-directed RNA polymerase subunit beta [Parcubacteria group bacterium GW2011_GWC2_38_7]
MSTPKTYKRKFFTSSYRLPLPDLIEVQKHSYDWFLREGLHELFTEVSPIIDISDKGLELYFDDYYLDEPKFDEVTSKEKNVTYEAPLRVKVTLKNTKTKKKETQEIFLCDFPVMTERGTFIINGIERVIVSQIIRSAGVFFTSNFVRERNRVFYGAKIIPNRGAWLEFETDANNVIWVKIDRKRKVAATSLLQAFGMNQGEIREALKESEKNPDINFTEATLAKDAAANQEEGLIEVYKRIRPGDLATADNAKSLIYAMFFNFDRYDFAKVGRYKMNQRFNNEFPLDEENRVLKVEDLVNVIKEIISLNISQEPADDIDHLGNRRIRAVGELVQNKFRVGLARMERIVKDRMSTMDPTTLSPSKLINARPVIGVVREFFMSSQLSQFMDQTNPLSELEHKRRISAMGPGGLSRERAGFDVRDVHTTHYGRICPIATPEGPNIGLVGHLASYARINDYGFIETPYFKISHTVTKDLKDPNTGVVLFKKGSTVTGVELDKSSVLPTDIVGNVETKVTDQVEYLNAIKEEKTITATFNAKIDEATGKFLTEKTDSRYYGQPVINYVFYIDYLDVSSNQIVSVATSLIPFLEHNDATRALMGTNMQRQAVPCIHPDSPIVGTGMEEVAARDSGHVVLAAEDSEVVALQGNRIDLLNKRGEIKSHRLNKYVCSNASTSINQRPTVDMGEKVKKGQVIADGPSVQNGELALGQNVLVAYMAWEGYNYEDAIIISQKLVHRDRYSSVHIENYTIDVRDTKLGAEVVTADIPNISEEKLKNLDAEGVVRIGATVKSGDILVGKITPKGETELSAEEKLLKAIFGEKARDVRDTSLRLEHGEQGKVVDIRVFSQENGDKLSPGVMKSIQITVANLRKIQVGDKLAGRHGNKGVISKIVPVEDMPFLEDGTTIDIILTPLGVASRMNLGQILETHFGLAAKKLGYKVATPVLNGVPTSVIKEELVKAGYPEDGQLVLTNGKTGEQFDHKITVGYKYMLKLNHMVEDKIHQRSIGPYSLITQQPLGGKAQFGGQRFGEMEVWALEAYGAAHTLQEILTIKSDDVVGRAKAYESIIKGEPIRRLNVPESFNVLVRELKGLCLDVELMKNGTRVAIDENTEDRKEQK